MNADLLMPADVTLPCVTNYRPFEAVLDHDAGSKPNRRAVAAAKRVCSGCNFRAECLNVNRTVPGVVAGLTDAERKRIAAVAA